MDIPKHIGRGRQIQDISGQRFSKLLVLDYAGIKNHKSLWECLCDCGNKTIVTRHDLVSGDTKSCGCLQVPHGMAGTTENVIWKTIVQRCTNPKDHNYLRYGGRGIRICERWRDFREFFADMGKRPEDHSIDRIDNDKGYECGKCPDCISRGTTKLNCRWVTAKQQARNRRNNMLLTHDGITMTLAEWAEKTGFHRSTISDRIERGYSIADALTRPIQKKINSRPEEYH